MGDIFHTLSLCTDKETGKQLERGKRILNLHSSDYKYIHNIHIYASYIYVYIYNIHNTYESFIDSHVYTSYTSTYTHGKKTKKKERLNLIKNREGYMGGLGGRQGKRGVM